MDDMSSIDCEYCPNGVFICREGHHHSNEENEIKPLLKVLKNCVKNCLPYICLFLFTIGYILIGATYFYYFESTFEEESKAREIVEFLAFNEKFNEKFLALKSSNHSSPPISEENLNKIQQELFNEFVLHIFRLKNSYSLTEKDLPNEISIEKTQVWTFSNSLFFATMILSTVGYGNSGLQPATIYAKIECIIFALFGIPLFFTSVVAIGRGTSECMIDLYKRYSKLKEMILIKIRKLLIRFCGIKETEPTESEQKPKCPNLVRIPPFVILLSFIAYIAFIGLLLKLWKGWSFMEAFFVSFTTMTTIGFGNELPSKNDSIFVVLIVIVFGIAFNSQAADFFQVIYRQKIHRLSSSVKQFFEFLYFIWQEYVLRKR